MLELFVILSLITYSNVDLDIDVNVDIDVKISKKIDE